MARSSQEVTDRFYNLVAVSEAADVRLPGRAKTPTPAARVRVLRTDNAADIRLDAVSENCVFYISPMYEFSHSLGQTRSFGFVGSMSGLPETGHERHRRGHSA